MKKIQSLKEIIGFNSSFKSAVLIRIVGELEAMLLPRRLYISILTLAIMISTSKLLEGL